MRIRYFRGWQYRRFHIPDLKRSFTSSISLSINFHISFKICLAADSATTRGDLKDSVGRSVLHPPRLRSVVQRLSVLDVSAMGMRRYCESLRSTQSHGRRLDELEATVGLSELWRLGVEEGGGDISGDGSDGVTHSAVPRRLLSEAKDLVSVKNSERRVFWSICDGA